MMMSSARSCQDRRGSLRSDERKSACRSTPSGGDLAADMADLPMPVTITGARLTHQIDGGDEGAPEPIVDRGRPMR